MSKGPLYWDVRDYSRAAQIYLGIENHNVEAEYSQGTFAWGDPGTETGHALDTAGVDRTVQQDGVGNYTAFLRIEVEQTLPNADLGLTEAFKLQYNHNGGGWTDVTASSSVVRVVANANIADGATTTNRIAGSAETFVAGRYDEGDGTTASITAATPGHTELLWSLEFVDTDLADTDTVDFRVVEDDGTLMFNAGTADNARLTWTAGAAPTQITGEAIGTSVGLSSNPASKVRLASEAIGTSVSQSSNAIPKVRLAGEAIGTSVSLYDLLVKVNRSEEAIGTSVGLSQNPSVGGPISVSLAPGTSPASSQALSPSLGAVTRALGVGSATGSSSALTALPGAIARALSFASVTSVGRTLTSTVGAVSRSIANAIAGLSGRILTTDLGGGTGEITQVGTVQSGSATNGGDVTLTFDGSPQQNDVVLLLMTSGGNYDPLPSGSGYSATASGSYYDSVRNATFQVGVKRLGASPDSGVTVTGSGNVADALTAISYVLRGVDETTIVDAVSAWLYQSSTTPDPPSVTTLTDNAWVFSSIHWGTADTVNGAGQPNGYSTHVEVAGADSNRAAQAEAHTTVATAGVEDPGTWSLSDSRGFGMLTIAIRPAATAGGVTVSLAQAALGGIASVLAKVAGAITRALTQGDSSVSGSSLTTAIGAVNRSVVEANATIQGRAISPSVGAATVDLTNATVGAAAQTLVESLGGVSAALINAIGTLTGQSIVPNVGGGFVSLSNAVASATSRTLSPTTGAVAVNLSAAEATALGSALNPTQGATIAVLGVADARVLAQSLNVTLGEATVALAQSGILVVSQVLDYQTALAVTLGGSQVALSAQALDKLTGPVSAGLTPAVADVLGGALGTSSAGLSVAIVQALADLIAQETTPSLGVREAALAAAVAAVNAQGLQVLPGSVSINIESATGNIVAEALGVVNIGFGDTGDIMRFTVILNRRGEHDVRVSRVTSLGSRINRIQPFDVER